MEPNAPNYLLWVGLNFGFAAIVASILLAMYHKLVGRLMDIIEKNTHALTALEKVVSAVCERLDRIEDRR